MTYKKVSTINANIIEVDLAKIKGKKVHVGDMLVSDYGYWKVIEIAEYYVNSELKRFAKILQIL